MPITSPTQDLLVEQDGGVLTLTLNRPDRLNAISVPMLRALSSTLQEANLDRTVRAIILTGAGRGFCSGLDLKAQDSGSDGDAVQLGRAGYQMFDLHNSPPIVINRMDKPIVCAINGAAAGYGMDLALGCDVRIAASSAKLAASFAKRGVLPESGGTWLLPRLVGRANALALAMTGDKLAAEEAQRIGLIWRCVDDAALADETAALAARLAEMPTRALAQTRLAIDATDGLDYAAALAAEARLQSTMGALGDYREGVAAFTAKRKPRFSDR